MIKKLTVQHTPWGELTAARVRNRLVAMTQSGFQVRRGPAGLHFFNRSTGINVLFDEIAIPTEAWSKAPRSVSIALTNACDLRCSYCYAPKHRARLPLEKIVSWCQELDSHGCFGVGFGGGEPTLHSRLVELCLEIEATTSLAISMTTHGHNFTSAFAARLAGHVHFIRVSVDGVGDTYERLRGRSFAVLRERLRAIRDVALFGVNCVVNEDTINELPAIAAFAADAGACELLLLPQHRHGVIAVSQEVQDQMSKWIRENFRNYRLAVSSVGAELVDSPTLPINDCPERDYAHIDANGVLKRTSFDHDGVPINEHASVVAALVELQRLRATSGLLRRTK